jgi:hypothetical protein
MCGSKPGRTHGRKITGMQNDNTPRVLQVFVEDEVVAILRAALQIGKLSAFIVIFVRRETNAQGHLFVSTPDILLTLSDKRRALI